MRTLVVVPTYDEADNIEVLLERVRAAAPDADILVVDDSSPDGTAGIARLAGKELGNVEVIERAHKGGLGSAYRHGFGVALERGYGRIVQIDADLSHDPADIPALLAALDTGAGLVVGSRYIPGGRIPHWPVHRRALSRWGNRYVRWVLALQVADSTSGYRAWDAETLRRAGVLDGHARGYLFQIDNAYRVVKVGARLTEVPIVFTDRVRGTSKMSGAVMGEALGMVTWWGLRDRLVGPLRRRIKR